ncbi:MAG: HAD family phosphatase [Thermodesulfobacteriota bacterium]
MKLKNPRKTVLLWDNDGVLVDTEVLYFRATRQAFSRVGVELTAETYHRFFLKESSGTLLLAKENALPEQTAEQLRKERNRIYTRMLQTENLIRPGVEQALSSLKEREIKMGVVTSSHADHFKTIHDRTGYGRFFDFVINGDDVAETKPSPEPYLKALQRAACSPQECVAIEDSERGLLSAKAAGIACWVIPTELSRFGDFRLADEVLSSISDVVRLIHPAN